MATKFKIVRTAFTMVIREEDIKVRKRQAPPSKPFKNKKIYSRSKVRIVASLEARQTSSISNLVR